MQTSATKSTVRRRGLLTGLTALLVAAAAACGGGTDPTSTPLAPTAVRQPTATAPPATSAPQPTATRPATGATPIAPVSPTARPTAAPQPTPVPQPTPTPTPVAPGYRPPDYPQAKYGGQLKRRLTVDPPSWDALREVAADALDALQPAFDQIVQVNPAKQDEIVPQLADTWNTSPDGLTWTFKIRRDVKFHTGSALTAEDFKYTYETMVLNPPQGVVSAYKTQLASVASIATPDDLTVMIKLREPDASFLQSIGFGRMAIFDKQFVEAGGRERTARWPPVGTGPFMGRDGGYVRGVSVEVVRNNGYFVKGRPFLDGMKFFVIPDPGTMLAAFLTGQINLSPELNESQVKEAQGRLGNRLTVQTTGTLTWVSVVMNAAAKPFDDARVRQAVALAVDKTGSIQLLGQGRGILGGHVAPGTGWGLTEAELKDFAGYSSDRAQNLAKAKKLLADAGFPSGFETVFYVRNIPSYVEQNTVVKAMLEEAGIKSRLELVDSAVFFENRVAGSQAWKIFASGWRANGPDPNDFYREFHLPGAPRYLAGLSDQKLLDLYNAQNRTPDQARRKQIIQEMERQSLAQYGDTIMYYTVAKFGWYANIKNHAFHVNYLANLQFRDVWIE